MFKNMKKIKDNLSQNQQLHKCKVIEIQYIFILETHFTTNKYYTHKTHY